MSLFYLGSAVLVIAAIVFTVWPLLTIRRVSVNAENSDDRQALNLSLYEDHLRDLERSLSHKEIDQPQFDSLKNELDRNLLEDSKVSINAKRSIIGKTSGSRRMPFMSYYVYIALAMLVLPIATYSFYQHLGSERGWQLKLRLDQRAALEAALYESPPDEAAIEHFRAFNLSLIDEMEIYLAERPDDLETTVLLARTAASLAQYPKAIEAYRNVLDREPKAAQIMAELAQTLFVQANNTIVPMVPDLAERALLIQPNNLTALNLMGIVDYNRAEYKKAIAHWRQAQSLYPAGSPNAVALERGINRAQARLLAKSDQDGDDIHSQEGEAPQAPVIKVAVSLAESVPVNISDTVFVYARAWQGAKLPLAIARLKASELPITLSLDNSMNMAPGMTLSSAEKVELVARLSPSGQAIAQAGDWQVSIGPIAPATAGTSVYPLVIKEAIQ